MNHAKTCKRKISHGKVTREIKTDASTQGWGAFSDGISTGSRWSAQEAQLHINALELLAVLWGLKALCSSEHHCHIKVLYDNTTTVSYLRNMGGSHSIPCNDIARDMAGLHLHISLVLRISKQTMLFGSLMTGQNGNLINKCCQTFFPCLANLILIYLHLDLTIS